MLRRTLFFGNPARLSIRREQLLVELPLSRKTRSISLEDVGIILLEHPQISVTHAVIQRCMKEGVVIINCDERHLPQGIMLPMEGHVELQERHQQQLSTSLPLRKQLWAQTVQAKINNQYRLLGQRGKVIPRMKRLVGEVVSGDAQNCEAQAAAIYWPALFETVPAFVRDRYGEPPNHLLNYGYAILRAMMARALVASGLLLALGIHHRNKYNPFCLADDIMEPYRPFVDALVCKLWDEGWDEEQLSVEQKTRLLEIATMDVRIDGQRSPFWNAVIRSAQSLQRCFAGSARKLLYADYESNT